MTTAELWEEIKYVIGVVIGVAAGKYGEKVFDWLRGYKKDKAEIKKLTSEADEIDEKIALMVAKELRDELREMREENKKLRAEHREEAARCKQQLTEMSDKVETLSNSLYEQNKRNNELERKIQTMDYEMRKYKPDVRGPGRV